MTRKKKLPSFIIAYPGAVGCGMRRFGATVCITGDVSGRPVKS